METVRYKGMKYHAEYGLLLVVEIPERDLIGIPYLAGTLDIEKRITELGGNLVLIRAGFQDKQDEQAILQALLELTRAVGGNVYK